MPLLDWYRRNRARSAALFDLLDDDAYYGRPIALRQPVVFYEGHLPAFSFNTLVKRGPGHSQSDYLSAVCAARRPPAGLMACNTDLSCSMSTGLTRWARKPARAERRWSCSCP